MATPRPPHGIFESTGPKALSLAQGLLIGGLILLVLLVCVSAYIFWRKRRKSRIVSPKNPWDELRSDIAASSQLPIPQQLEALNLSLRKGLELKTGKLYSALTSNETLIELKRDPEFSSDFQTLCAEFVKTSDRVLYASETCDEESLNRWNRQISSWLDSLQVGRPL